MFSASYVDALFASALKDVHRSQLMLEERARVCGQAARQLSKEVAGATVAAGGLASSSSSSERSASGLSAASHAIREERGLKHFASFLSAAEEVGQRLAAEFTRVATGAARPRLRAKATAFPVLVDVQRGLEVCGMVASGSQCVEALWADGGAAVAEMLLLAAVCVDFVEDNEKALQALARECGAVMAGAASASTSSERGGRAGAVDVDRVAVWESALVAVLAARGDDGLGRRLASAASLLPEPLLADLGQRVLSVLQSWWSVRQALPQAAAAGARPPGAETADSFAPMPLPRLPPLAPILLYPSLVRWLAARNTPEAFDELICNALVGLSRQLLTDFLSLRRDAFPLHAAQLATSFDVAARCLVGGAEPATPSADATLSLLRRLVDAVVQPLEDAFTSSAARPGMSWALYAHLALPLLHGVTGTTVLMKRTASGGRGDATSTALSSVLRTAVYRVWMIVQTVTAAEVALAKGTGSKATQQRTYEIMLQLSGGKITLPLLSKVAEAKNAVLDETPARSADGHRVYRISAGGDDADSVAAKPLAVDGTAAPAPAVVSLYVDDGVVMFRVGRERSFRRAKSLDDLFAYVNGPGQ